LILDRLNAQLYNVSFHTCMLYLKSKTPFPKRFQIKIVFEMIWNQNHFWIIILSKLC